MGFHYILNPPRIFHISIPSLHVLYRPLVKSACQKNNFLISQPKHLFLVLKRTVSMRRFFLAPKTSIQTDGLENIYNFYVQKFCLSKPMLFSSLGHLAHAQVEVLVQCQRRENTIVRSES